MGIGDTENFCTNVAVKNRCELAEVMMENQMSCFFRHNKLLQVNERDKSKDVIV